MLNAGDRVGGRYQVERPLAGGGQSHVCLVRRIGQAEDDDTRWIIKEIRQDEAFSGALVRDMLQAEIDALKRLEHPGLMRVDDCVYENDRLYMVAAYVPGRPLDEYLRSCGAFSEREAVDIGLQICDMLGYLHTRKQSVIYRDLKPSNLILCPDGHVVLIDFGSALLRGRSFETDRTAMGTRGYAAPEQYGGTGEVCDATDIYALGKTLIALVTGGKTSLRRARNMSPAFCAVLRRCTCADPGKRYRKVAEVYCALRNLQKSGTLAYRLSSFLGAEEKEAKRLQKSAGINGVFRIGPHMPTKRALSLKDIEVPLDEPMTDVRLGLHNNSVNYVTMDGFLLERDVMVTMRENYEL